jgi:hypothetical protein
MYLQIKLLALLLFGMLLLLSGISNFAFAILDEVTVLKLTVNTDRDIYYPGDKAIVSGFVAPDILTAGQQVVLFIHDPHGAIVRSDLVLPYSNGTFWYEMPIGGQLGKSVGHYRVVANYMGKYQSETEFQLTSGEGGDYRCILRTCIFELHFNNNSTYQISYRMSGVIQNITVDVVSKSLLVDTLVYARSSSLRISLPSNLINAAELDQNGVQKLYNFTVLVNGDNAEQVEEIEHGQDPVYPNDYREIYISELQQGQNRVQIIGTWVAPEFGSLVIVVAAAASIVSVMILLSRFGSLSGVRM